MAGGFLDPRMETSFDLETLAGALTLQRDVLFGFAGLSTLLDRYAIKNAAQKPIETPQFFFMRVAMGLSYNEGAGTPDAKQQATAAAIAFYNRMSRLEYVAGGSTNIGAGTTRPALSNCYLLQIEDDMEHIAKSVSDIMMLQKRLAVLVRLSRSFVRAVHRFLRTTLSQADQHHSRKSSTPLSVQFSVAERKKAHSASIWRTGTLISLTSLCGVTMPAMTTSACVLQTPPCFFRTNSCVV